MSEQIWSETQRRYLTVVNATAWGSQSLVDAFVVKDGQPYPSQTENLLVTYTNGKHHRMPYSWRSDVQRLFMPRPLTLMTPIHMVAAMSGSNADPVGEMVEVDFVIESRWDSKDRRAIKLLFRRNLKVSSSVRDEAAMMWAVSRREAALKELEHALASALKYADKSTSCKLRVSNLDTKIQKLEAKMAKSKGNAS